MIIGIGTDLVSLSRIERILESYPDKFIEKICHPEEIEYLNVIPAKAGILKKTRFLTSSFAIKEALAKACGTGFSQGLWFSQICVLRSSSGAPGFKTFGPFEEYLRTLEVSKTHLSVSYEKDLCQAIVILEK